MGGDHMIIVDAIEYDGALAQDIMIKCAFDIWDIKRIASDMHDETRSYVYLYDSDSRNIVVHIDEKFDAFMTRLNDMNNSDKNKEE
jgi:hypothetical protein